MAGRKPIPTGIKLVTGRPGRGINNNEPDPQGKVRKPGFVKDKAAALWKQYAPELIRMGVLKSTDAHMFGVWCWLMAEFEESPRHFNAAKLTQLRALASSFGMDPSSRSRIAVTGNNIGNDPAEEYFS